VKKKRVVFYTEDIMLPDENNKLKQVIKNNVDKGYCDKCKKWQSSILLPPARCVLGQKLKLYICYLSILLRLTFEQIQQILKDTYQIQISDGEIAKILGKEADRLRPEYERLKVRIRKQKACHYDETGWKVQKEEQGNYAWVMVGAQSNEAAFLCGQSRGKGNAEKLKGKSKSIGISDGYGVYKNMFSEHQLCLAHPNRKLRDLANSDNLDQGKRFHCANVYRNFSKVYSKLRLVLETDFDIEKRKEIKDKLIKQLKNITVSNVNDPEKLSKIKAHLRENLGKYFTCLLFPNIPCDNNKAERALRHLVIKRKTSFGSKTQRGAETTSILTSILLSLKWSEPENFFENYLKLSDRNTV
jgi:transposase